MEARRPTGNLHLQAREELAAAEASGDVTAIERAKEKLVLMFDAHPKNGGMADLDAIWEYIETNKRAFE